MNRYKKVYSQSHDFALDKTVTGYKRCFWFETIHAGKQTKWGMKA
jgi:hypothetical protein